MKLHSMENRSKQGFVTWGGYWEKGTVREEDGFVLTGENGEEIPVQSEVSAYWPDHSVKWTSHSADAGLIGKTAELVPVKGLKKQEKTVVVSESADAFFLQAGKTSLEIEKSGEKIFRHFISEGKKEAEDAGLVLILEEREESGESVSLLQRKYVGVPSDVTIEECGALKCVARISGTYHSKETGRDVFPFVVRITVWKDCPKLDIQHTFIYDGDEKKDFLKGIGLEVTASLNGAPWNRQAAMQLDCSDFREASVLLLSWHPRIPAEIYQAQINGEILPEDSEEAKPFLDAASKMPIWDNYRLIQDSAEHCLVEKQTKEKGVCWIPAMHGTRARGAMAFGDAEGGIMACLKNFWQKYPSGLEIRGLTQEKTKGIIWFYTPEARAFDYRHYDVKGYSQTYYEGFDEFGATPYGIANTSELSLKLYAGRIPTEEELEEFSFEVRKPAVYLGEIKYYHDLRAFGYWSMKNPEPSEMEAWLEKQLENAFAFYRDEVEVRRWYGFYDYGDIMHTYDSARHCWKYDMGGYAWQNTELVPTLWLWLYFMRTQREDVFTIAEAMSRHCSETDVYHLGPYKGIGSRHNVRHWGCPCKEARIGMAGHHRPYYYLTGDPRMRDIFDNDRDADWSLLNIDPLRFFYDKEKMVSPTHARSGPDWSSFCSNWMTQWERFDDRKYLEKIKTGVADLKKAPLRLISGSDFEYNPADCHLRYIGERAGGGSHLQICQGAAQVWTEMSLLIDDPEWNDMLAEYGKFYFAPREEQVRISKGLIGERQFSIPFLASGIASYAAAYYRDQELAATTWRILMRALTSDYDHEGFAHTDLLNTADRKVLHEIPWITTNFTGQWCLNVIMVLEFIRKELPENWEKMEELMSDMKLDGYHRC